MDSKKELRNWIETQINEKYMVLTGLSIREAINKYGFYLSPAENRIIDGVKHYRVIFPKSQKGGWAPTYDTPIDQHYSNSQVPSSIEG